MLSLYIVYICTHRDLLLGGVLDLRLRDGGDPLRGGGERPNRDDRGGDERRPLPNLAREENILCQLQNLNTHASISGSEAGASRA